MALEFPVKRLEGLALRFQIKICGKILTQSRIVSEGICLRIRIDEEVERIDDRQLGKEIHFDREMIDRLGEDDARLPVAVRILLPVQEVIGWTDFQRVIGHRRAAVWRRPQTDHLRPQIDGPAIVIAREMMEPRLYHKPCVRQSLVHRNMFRDLCVLDSREASG